MSRHTDTYPVEHDEYVKLSAGVRFVNPGHPPSQLSALTLNYSAKSGFRYRLL